MTAFDFVSHESYPEDEYTKEAVVLCLDKKHRVTYLRKKMQNGGMFWDVVSAAVKQNGEKKYLKAYTQDSMFLHDDIKAFLENREWERGVARPQGGKVAQKSDDLPF
jgi:hypothetical protein